MATIHRTHDINNLEFVRATNGQKSTTRARRNGCSRDHCACRGRWRQRKRQVDDYTIEPTAVPWPDAKVAQALCKGGSFHFVVKEGSGISE